MMSYNINTLINPYKYKQLFLDYAEVEAVRGVTQKLHHPDRLGPIFRPDTSIGQTHIQSSTAPQWNPETKLWEIVYSAAYDLDDKEVVFKELATSDDGIHWHPENESRHSGFESYSNRAYYYSDERNLEHLLRDDNDVDPQRRYKALFSDKRHCDRYPGFSPDGREWSISDTTPIPSNDTSRVFIDHLYRRYVATVKHRTEWGRSAWLTTSYDFMNWSTPILVMHTDEIDLENRKKRIQSVIEDPNYLTPGTVDDKPYRAEVYILPIMPYEGIYIGFPLIFNPSGLDPLQMNHTGINQTELAVSRDLMSWERIANREVWLGVEPWDGVNYGTAQVALIDQPIVRDGKIWVYYLAYRFRGHRSLFSHIDIKYLYDWGAICLATLRLDGFVSLYAGNEGSVVTKPFSVTGGRLMVNVDASAGELVAEVIDPISMKPLNGFFADDCMSISGNSTKSQIIWRNRDIPQTKIRLRFILRKAHLYSYWLEHV